MKEFKRINFFKGFFTRAEDWQSAQKYHLEKRKAHNKFLHTPGIVFGCEEDLKVSVVDTTLKIAPGYAIDGNGNDLYLPRSEKLEIPIHKPGTTIYVIIRYNEEKIDKRENIENPEYSDYAFIKEYPIVETSNDEPDNNIAIELARIKFSKGEARIKNPSDPNNPGSNEINMRFVKRAGAIKERVNLENIGEVFKGELTVNGQLTNDAKQDFAPSKTDPNVPLDNVTGKDPHMFYLVSAIPDVENAIIMWRIETEYNKTKDSVQYKLYFQNRSDCDTLVNYRVCRLY
ncbi:MAG: hypothetical protein GY797_01935 [Deltaproteobacteria bacterium]|nr:hypothetical protein [Deltaproteobacteria bacterium]